MINLLRWLLKLNEAMEVLVIDLIASWTPWVAPLIPAYMTYSSMTSKLSFPGWVAWAGAIAVEFLGLSSIQTAVTFWNYNSEKRVSDPRAPILVAILVGAFYLAVVITVNAILDTSGGLKILSKALLSSVSVSAGMTIALRAGHVRRLQQVEAARQERREARKGFQVFTPAPPALSEGRKDNENSESLRKDQVISESYDWRNLSDDEQMSLAGKSAAQIRMEYPGITARTALNWVMRARQVEKSAGGDR